MLSCSQQENTHVHVHGTNGAHAHDELSISYTEFSDKYQLFVEFEPLVLNRKVSFATHLTLLEGFKPIKTGSLTVTLTNRSSERSVTVD